MGRIAVTDGMSPDAISKLEKAGHEVIIEHHDNDQILEGSLSKFDAVIIRSATKLHAKQIEASVLEKGGVKFIGRAGVGVDNIDVDTATKHGIVVCNTPGASTKSVVELTIGHLLASTRHIATADRTLRNGEWAKKRLRGSEIGGKRLGLVGFGRISRGVAKVASAFDMEIHAFDPYIKGDVEGVIMHNTVEEVFKICTHISIHCNLTEETREMVNSEMISLMPGIGLDGTKCGNHIVSCARGGIIDEKAAYDALVSGKLSSLALDVFDIEPLGDSLLLELENFHGSPHIAASTIEAQERVGTEMASLLIEFFEDGKPSYSVN